MWLTVDGVSMREGELPLGELLTRDNVTTSGPTPGEFEQAVKERQRGTDDGVVVFTLAATMSSTYEAAVVGRAGRRRTGACRRHDDRGRRSSAGRARSCGSRATGRAARRSRSNRAPGDRRDEARRHGAQSRLHRRERPRSEHRGLGDEAPRHRAALRVSRRKRARAAARRVVQQQRSTASSRAGARIACRTRACMSPPCTRKTKPMPTNSSTACRAECEPATAFLGTFGTVMLVHTGPGLVGLAWRWEPVSAPE